jgi:hypothetical protein
VTAPKWVWDYVSEQKPERMKPRRVSKKGWWRRVRARMEIVKKQECREKVLMSGDGERKKSVATERCGERKRGIAEGIEGTFEVFWVCSQTG